MELTGDFGKRMRDRGRGRVRRASSTRRFMRCRVTESRATFFDTTTAYPRPSFEARAVKFADENLLPSESSVGNASRASRSLRGNTKIRRRGAYDRCGGGSELFYGQNLFSYARGIRGSAHVYVSLVDRFVWPCRNLVMHMIVTGSPRNTSVPLRPLKAYTLEYHG